MEVKGVAVVVFRSFITEKFGQAGYSDWLAYLPPESVDIHRQSIDPNAWYPIRQAFISPTQAMCATDSTGATPGGLGDRALQRPLRLPRFPALDPEAGLGEDVPAEVDGGHAHLLPAQRPGRSRNRREPCQDMHHPLPGAEPAGGPPYSRLVGGRPGGPRAEGGFLDGRQITGQGRSLYGDRFDMEVTIAA